MKKLSEYFILILLMTLVVGCTSKVETYEPKGVVVESVFDDLQVRPSNGEVKSVFSELESYENNAGVDSEPPNREVVDIVGEEANVDADDEMIMAASVLLRMRLDSSTDSTTIKLLQPGEEVSVLDEGVGLDGIFSRVRSGEDVGYVATEFLIEPGILPVYVPEP